MCVLNVIAKKQRDPKEEYNYVTSEDFAVRLLEIQTKISNIRSSQGWDRKPNRNLEAVTKLEENRTVHKTNDERVSREQEMNELKMKLMKGKK